MKAQHFLISAALRDYYTARAQWEATEDAYTRIRLLSVMEKFEGLVQELGGSVLPWSEKGIRNQAKATYWDLAGGIDAEWRDIQNENS